MMGGVTGGSVGWEASQEARGDRGASCRVQPRAGRSPGYLGTRAEGERRRRRLLKRRFAGAEERMHVEMVN